MAAGDPVHPNRIRPLNTEPLNASGDYVLYWMQASQRAVFNPALEHAAELANAHGKPLVVCFGLMDDFPEANERHYAYLLAGLADVRRGVEARGAAFVCRHGPAADAAIALAARAVEIVCDRGYLRFQIAWREKVAAHSGRRVTQVEGDVVVPVETASNKHEIGARTLRPKLHRLWEEYLRPLAEVRLKEDAGRLLVEVDRPMNVADPATLGRLKLDRSLGPVPGLAGGHTAAMERFAKFVSAASGGLTGYGEGRNEPAGGQSSRMSMALHYGHVSPVELALAARESRTPAADRDVFLEELIVRRELSMNFVRFNPDYDRYEGTPAWARKSLAAHAGDRRAHVYSRAELEAGRTHDVYWNAAQTEMVRTGFMHNYMRMYWGKKILEWTADPAEAWATTLYLNNRYFLCGRDPNAWANVSWIYGLHDRPWGPERPIFGLVRYMNAAGLERKFDIDRYVAKVAAM